MKAKCVMIVGIVVSMLVSAFVIHVPIAHAMPYDSYNYSYWVYPVRSPAPYLPAQVLTGQDLGSGNFNEPRDMYVSGTGKVYVADSGHNRIIVFNSDWTFDREIDQFTNEGNKDEFNMPIGIYVDQHDTLYVADRDNRRIVILDEHDQLIGTVANPQSDILQDDFTFLPTKVRADTAGRIFVVAQGVFEGLMEFSPEGEFQAFTGTNHVRPNISDYFWRLVATEAQRERMIKFIPTEFTNLDIDDRNFIYATNIDPGTNEPIKRINAFGNDILKRHGYHHVAGDLRYNRRGVDQGPSRMADIIVNEDGKYSVLDSNRGRIFTYDDEGNLLYIFGGLGNQRGTFRTPVSIALKDGQFLVLDRQRAMITVFDETTFGKLVNEAVHYQYHGFLDEAAHAWEQVLKYNANYELAYMGLGKSLLRQGYHEAALEMFELGMDKEYYGIAYKRYRRNALKESYELILTILSVAALGIGATFVYRRVRKRGGRVADPRS